MNTQNHLTKQKSIALASVLILGLNLSACGGSSGGSNETDGEDEDLTAPTVSSTSPVDNANDVPRNSTITATFNEDILNTSVDATSFTLLKSSGEDIAGNVSFDGANNVASFTPDSPLAILVTYTATLSNSIADLSGNALASNYNWSFTTADGAWGNAEEIDTYDADNIGNPQIAFDNNGNAMAVWSQKNDIWANYFNGTNWGDAELIEIKDEGAALKPQIAFDNNGNALAVWEQSDGSNYNIWANRFNGSSWGNAELIEGNDAGSANAQKIAFDNNGNALAVWRQYDGSRYSVWSNRFNGSSWMSAELIETDDTTGVGDPQIAFDNNGNALAVWEQSDGNTYNIWTNRFNGSSWGNAEVIESESIIATMPQIAFDHNGNAMAVWSLYKNTNYSIWANRFNGSSWLGSELIGIDDGNDAFMAQIAFDNNGNALAVWYQWDGNRNNIWANHFNGSNWGNAIQIETNAGSALDPQIAFDNSGNALAVWQQSDGTRNNIWANRFNGSNWLGADLIETEDAGNAYIPQISFDPNGNAIAVWRQSNGNGQINIMVNRFE